MIGRGCPGGYEDKRNYGSSKKGGRGGEDGGQMGAGGSGVFDTK